MFNLQEKKLISSVSYFSVITATIIMIVKIYGWIITDSQSLFASLIDSILDITASMINLVAIRISFLPPDNNHRFGYEKFQDLAIFSQSMFFLASGLFIIFSVSKMLLTGTKLMNPEIGIHSMYICIILTLLLVIYQTYVIRKTNSAIISADRLHYFTDFLTNFTVIISIYISTMVWYFDMIIAFLMSLYIIRSSYKLFRNAVRNLVDEELPQEDKDKIIEIIKKYPIVTGVHEFRTRHAANKEFIQFHMELDGTMSLHDAHKISDMILDELLKIFPNADIIIHQDPSNYENNVLYREKM